MTRPKAAIAGTTLDRTGGGTGLARRRPERLAEAQAQAALYYPRVFIIAPTDADTILAAIDLAQRHQPQLWDVVIWSRLRPRPAPWVLPGEDLQDGLVLDSACVIDPFAAADP